ncbi:amino acid adenylation domain-containing protein [Streptomyces sp. NBC_00340]|uniref:non-ribosomal peptide synthetase n=1 Tax=Streptomyces sp. NBC_00340 TaxID=2975716 RepID=UPI00224EF5DE|nr:non-ribosomal peptide synthetase [Streptomyces sp. NBC_00340]MCX5134082.1 amino acid adenylation domain-containing protein [Streptomyces sp. NBC_00340]
MTTNPMAPPAPAPGREAGREPFSPAEGRIAAVWGSVLGTEVTSADSDFFELGGTGEQAGEMGRRIAEEFGSEFRSPSAPGPLTVRTVASFLAEEAMERTRRLFEAVEEGMDDGSDALAAASASDDTTTIPLAVRDGRPMPLSFAQRRLWFLDQLDPGRAEYLIPMGLRISGPLDVAALEAALTELVERHEVLRTRFVTDEDGTPGQIVDEPRPLPLALHDLRYVTDDGAREKAATALVDTEGFKPVDLSTGPMVRALLLRLADEEHLLSLTVHHIAFDGWSVGVLSRELTTLYTARVTGVAAGLPEPPLQYADFAVWQRSWFTGDVLSNQLDYWRGRLAGTEALELPTDRRRPARRSGNGAMLTFGVPAATADGARRLAHDTGASLFMTLLAVFQAVLSRYSGQEDIAVGTPIAGRNRAEIEDMVGFFVNTLVMRTDLSGDPTFTELIDRVKDTALGAYDHQDMPFERLVEELAPQRDLSRNPLFQTMFVLQNTPDSRSWELPGLSVRQVDVAAQESKFDFTFYATEAAHGGLDCTIVYSTDLFDEATMVRLGGHFETLLGAAADSPTAPLSALEMLTARERREILTTWNGADTDAPDSVTVHRLFEDRAAERPNSPAVTCGSDHLSYQELDARAEWIAARLRERGAGPGTLVAICLDRGTDMVSALLGILKSGAAYVPLDPAYPTDRLAYMIEDSGAPLIVTRTTHVDRLPAATPRLLLEDWPEELPPRTGGASAPEAGPDDLAYVIYTSGSTGRPKGVQITHGALRARMRETRRQLDLTCEDRVLQFASISFDSSVGQLFAPLVSGASLVLRDDAWDPGMLAEALRTNAVTVAWLTPSAFGALAAQLGGPDDLGPELRLVRLGGEALQREQVRQWFRHTSVPLVNGYGPTEAAQEAATARITGPGDHVPIGRPVANAKVFLVDRHGRPVPVGVPGEMWIGCPGLARGYLGRPELTAEKFTVVTVDGTPRRVYRTGDLAKWHPDGHLEFVGRGDNQVKLRGYRIEPGEIEAALLTHPSVTGATVLLREDVPGDPRLVAYVVADPPVEAGVLRAHLQRDLPDYMVPAAFVALDRIPLTPNGKTDRRALPAPASDRPELGAAYTAPRTETERTVAAVWAEVLGIDTVGADDDFFALGGHSLLATQVVSRLRRRLGVDVPVRALFGAPTPALLAAAVEDLDEAGISRIPAVPRDGGPLPLSFAQQRLWFLDQLEPGRAEYLLPFAFRVHGVVDVDALNNAFTALVERHEILRTRFGTDEAGSAVQSIAPAGPVTVLVRDLRSFADAPAREDALAAVLAGDALRPVDLAAGPMLRAVLVRLADEEAVLAVTVHHIAFDGWSIGVLLRELSALYAVALGAGSDAVPAPLPVQYADYALWQRSWLTGEALERQLGYWRGRLAGLEPLELPTDHARPAERTGTGEVVRFSVPADVAARARAVSAEGGASLFMTLLSVFQLLLARYSGQRDVAVGTPIAGRNRAETEELIGFFVNTLVLRTDLSGDPAFSELLARVKDTALGAYDHQDLPFERLVEELSPDRDLSRNPLFQTLFALQNTPGTDAWSLPGLTAEPVESPVREAKFDLSMYLAEASDGTLDGAVVYAADLFTESTARRLVDHFTILLDAATAQPQSAMSELEMLGSDERDRIVTEWNATSAPVPAEATLHQLFEERAALTPDAVAVVCDSDELTYRELDARANQLAHRLRAVPGIGPDVPVGVCLERSPALVWTLLGILKAGAAYVPLDPEHPAERLAYLVEDSGAPLVVTDTAHAGLLPEGLGLLAVDSATDLPDTLPVTAPDPIAVPGDLSYLIYTSGSTGRPKGVRIEHRGVVNYLAGMQDAFPITPGEGFLQATPLSFDVSAYEIFWPLWQGATVVLVPGSDRLDMTEVSRLMRDHRVVGLHFVPSLLDLFVSQARPEDCAHLRYAFASGEPLQPTLVARFLDRFPGDLINLYGATEVSVDTTYWRASRTDPGGPVLAGRPMVNQTVYVLDPDRRPVPAGVLGEVYLGGDSVGRGYHERPEFTAQRFVPDPFTGGRMYRTGDVGRFTSDGELDLLGRIDRQVKLRGVRVELGEIEAVLLTHDAVGVCAVAVREDAPGDKRLVAYYVPAPGATADTAELRGWAAERLPRAMMPSAFVDLPELPLNRNGKVDHAALPAPGESDIAAGFVAPRDEIEAEIAGIMAAVLGIEKVGIHDGFFDVGGHSLLAIQLVNRVEAVTGVRIGLRQFFQVPTVAGVKEQLIELFDTQENEQEQAS